MRRISSYVFLGLVAATSVQASQPWQDDFVNHLTVAGGTSVLHTASVVKEITGGNDIFYDPRLPAGQQLCLRPKGNLMKYTCPAVSGVSGLENPRPMGVCPQYLAYEDDTKIDLLRATYDYGTFSVIAGLYRPLSSVTLRSIIQDGLRVNTNRMTCITGLDDGLVLTIDYNESYHHIASSYDINAGQLQLVNPATQDSPCLTFSCWYLPSAVGRNGATMPLFSIGYPATETGLQGQTKTIQLGVNSLNTMKSIISLQVPVVEVETCQKTIVTQRSVPVPAVIIPGTPAVNIKQKVKGGYSWYYARATPAKSIPQPNKTVEERTNITENVNVLKSKVWTLAEQTSDNWMNIAFSINLNTKIGRVYNNGNLLFEYMNLSAIPLNSICTMHFGQQTALIAEVILTNQFCYNPAAFGCFNSQNNWVPKKSVAPAQLGGLQPLSNKTPTSL